MPKTLQLAVKSKHLRLLGARKKKMMVCILCLLGSYVFALTVLDFFELPQTYDQISAWNEKLNEEIRAPDAPLKTATSIQDLEKIPTEPPAKPEEDCLGILGGIQRLTEQNAASKEKLSITSKKFNAAFYLTTLHRNTSYADLLKGLKNLRELIASRTLKLRDLIKENFERYVSARNTVRMILASLKDKTSVEELEKLHRTLQTSHAEAQDLLGPLIDSQKNQLAIKHRLTVLSELAPLLNAHKKMSHALSARNYAAASAAYVAAKGVYADLRHTPAIDAFWTCIKAQADAVCEKIVLKVKNPRLSIGTVTMHLKTLAVLDYSDNLLDFYLSHQEDCFRAISQKSAKIKSMLGDVQINLADDCRPLYDEITAALHKKQWDRLGSINCFSALRYAFQTVDDAVLSVGKTCILIREVTDAIGDASSSATANRKLSAIFNVLEGFIKFFESAINDIIEWEPKFDFKLGNKDFFYFFLLQIFKIVSVTSIFTRLTDVFVMLNSVIDNVTLEAFFQKIVWFCGVSTDFLLQKFKMSKIFAVRLILMFV